MNTMQTNPQDILKTLSLSAIKNIPTAAGIAKAVNICKPLLANFKNSTFCPL